jgi:homoserine dehydrogenase
VTQQIKIGILGCGTVGQGLVKLLADFPNIQVAKICVRDLNKPRDLNLATEVFTTNPDEVLDDPEIDVVVELMGGIDHTHELLVKAFKNGKNVVSANKDLIAVRGEELFKVAAENDKTILYEAAVAGGIPIISTLKQSLKGNQIKAIYGIINGTTNFILDQMKNSGASFADALAEATELGYAEADPTNDVGGHDAAYKIAILASIITDRKVAHEDVFREGITNISEADMKSASKRGYVIKLLAIAKTKSTGLDVRVHPVFVPKNKTLASISAENNAIMLDGNAVGELTLIGKGAGSFATASAVLGDLLMFAYKDSGFNQQFAVEKHSQEATLIPFSEIENSFYVRISMFDKVGVLHNLGKILMANNANVKFIDQYDVHDDEAHADFMLDPIPEASMTKIKEELEKLPSIKKVESVIRVMQG